MAGQQRVQVAGLSTRGSITPVAGGQANNYVAPRPADNTKVKQLSQLASALQGWRQSTNAAQSVVARDVQETKRQEALIEEQQRREEAARQRKLEQLQARQEAEREKELERVGQTAARRDLALLTPEEAQERARNGDLDGWDNPYYRSEFLAGTGQRVAGVRRRELIRWMSENEDVTAEEVDARMAEMAEEDMALFGDSEEFILGYDSLFSKFAPQLRDAAYKAETAQVARERDAMVAENLWSSAEVLMDQEDATAADVVAGIRSNFENLRELGLSYSDLEETVIRQVLPEIAAEGRTDIIDAYFEDTKSRNGVGPLGGSLKYRDAWRELKAGAEKVRMQSMADQRTRAFLEFDDIADAGEWSEDTTNAAIEAGISAEKIASWRNRSESSRNTRISASQKDMALSQWFMENAEAMDEQGVAFSSLRDEAFQMEDGSIVEVTADQKKEFAVQKFDQMIQMKVDIARSKGTMSEEDLENLAFNEEVKLWARTDMKNPRWEAAFGNIETALYAVDPSNPEQVGPVVDTLNLYASLTQANPGLADRHVTDDTQMFLKPYVSMRQHLQNTGMDPQQASVQALSDLAELARNPERQRFLFEEGREEIDKLSDDILDGLTGNTFWGGVKSYYKTILGFSPQGLLLDAIFDDSPVSSGLSEADLQDTDRSILKEHIRTQAAPLAAMGLPVEEAVLEAARVVDRNTLVFNNEPVFFKGGKPPMVEQYIERILEDPILLERLDDEGLAVEDLRIAPGRQPGTFVIKVLNGYPQNLQQFLGEGIGLSEFSIDNYGQILAKEREDEFLEGLENRRRWSDPNNISLPENLGP